MKLVEILVNNEAKTEELIIGLDYYAVIGHFLIGANREEAELSQIWFHLSQENVIKDSIRRTKECKFKYNPFQITHIYFNNDNFL